MGYSEDEHYLLSQRDKEEAERLNLQHKMIAKVREGHVLDPLIPKKDISRIADIATGTGIWLKDAMEELSQAGNDHLELIGFDISSAQFPKTSEPGIEFVESDMMKPFDKKYLGYFDIVHVRLVMLVITKDQIKPFVENMVTLLKPGGYLQWDDFDFHDRAERLQPASLAADAAPIMDFFRSQNWSLNLFTDVAEALRDSPIEDVHVTDYVSAAEKRPEIRDEMYEWHKQIQKGVLVPVYLRSGKAKNTSEAIALVQERTDRADAVAKAGGIFPKPLATLIGRKKLTSV